MARRFHINRSFSGYTVQSTSGSKLYYVDQSTYTPLKPDLTLHAGSTTHGPILAVAHMPKLSGDFKIGLGEPPSARWEDMTKETLTASEHRWAMTLPGTDEDGKKSDQRCGFMWKRTHSVGADGASLFLLSTRNYKLLDSKTNEILAMFTKEVSFTRCGTLQINVDYGNDFDLMVMITCLSLYEKSGQRKQYLA